MSAPPPPLTSSPRASWAMRVVFLCYDTLLGLTWVVLLPLCLLLGLAMLSYHLFEKHFFKLKKYFSTR